MSPSKTAVLAVAGLLCIAGGAAAAGAVSPGPDEAQATPQPSMPTNVDATATTDNGTLELTVSADGSPAQNVSVTYDDRTQMTDASGTVSFDLSEDDDGEVELALEKDGFEGELEYVLHDGSLLLVEEEYEYEYEEIDADEDDDSDEAEADEPDDDDGDDADDDAEDDETEDEEDDAEDEEDVEDDDDEDDDDEDDDDEDGDDESNEE